MEGKMKELYQKNILDFLTLQLNKPYIWGNIGPDSFDCSGLTKYIYKELFNIDIEENGYGIGDTTKQMTSSIGTLKKYIENDSHKKEYIKELEIGDLIFFHRQSPKDTTPTPNNRYPGHVGIYIGNNQFIHASSDEEKVVISPLDDYWLKILVGSKNILNTLIITKEL